MNSSNFRFTLDLHSVQSQYSIPVMLGDTGITWHISLTDGGVPYVINDGCLAKLSIKRPTGSHIEEFCEIKNNSIIEYPFSQNENTCAVEGLHYCDVTLYSLDGEKVGSPSFTMVVSEKVIKRDDIELTDDDYTAVEAMLTEEAQRQSAETERIAAEEQRISAETQRIADEEERGIAEFARETSEQRRESSEVYRVNNENDRVNAERERISNEAIRVQKDSERDSKIAQAEAASANAVEKSDFATAEVETFRKEIGSEELVMYKETVKAAVNDAVILSTQAHANSVYYKNQSDVLRNNLANLTAQVQGIGRSYVVRTFYELLDFLQSMHYVELKEDRNGDGVDETYNVYVSDLKTGDNILIVEEGVPDFWFERNSAITLDPYTYKTGTEHGLYARVNGETIGGVHILETDYTVIEGYATSASASAAVATEQANLARASALEAKHYEGLALEEEALAYEHMESAKASATEAKEAASIANEIVGASFANSLTGKAVGAVVRVDDISPVPHELDITVESKNLLNFADNFTIHNGILNSDGSISANFLNGYYVYPISKNMNDLFMANRGKHLTLSVEEIDKDKSLAFLIYGTRTNGASYQSCMGAAGSRSCTLQIATDFTEITKLELRLGRKGDPYDDTTTVYRNIQLELGNVATEYAPYVDVNATSVKVYGKNLANILENFDTSGSDLTTTKLISKSGFYCSCIPVLPNTTYTLSKASNEGGRFRWFFYDREPVVAETNSIGGAYYDSYAVKTLTTPANAKYMVVAWGEKLDNFQVELGAAATEYVPYVEVVTKVVENGKVKGAYSKYPCTTVIPAPNTVIDCTYNRDINKAFNELCNAIISLGGNV